MEEDVTVNIKKIVLKEIYSILEQIRSIETLEYHNCNHLAVTNPGERSALKIDLTTTAINILDPFVKRETGV